MKFKEIVGIAEVVVKKKVPSKIDGLIIGEYGYILAKSVLAPGKEILKLYFKNGPNPSGDTINQTLTKKEFTVIANSVNKFITSNKRLPNYVSHQNKKINIKLCIYCFAKIIIFYNKNKRLPNTCEFNSNDLKTSSTTTKGGAVCKKLAQLTKVDINNYKDVYKAMSKFSYRYYYDDVKTQAKTLSDMAGNCTDLNQIEYAALKELGYNVQIVRGLVKCNDNKTYGHIWCRIKLNNTWTNIDASAAAKGKSLGSVICSKVVEITDVNPSWAVSDDGRT